MVATVLPIQKTSKVHVFHPKTIQRFFKILLFISQCFCAAPVLNSKKCCLFTLHYIWCIFILACIVLSSWSMEEILEVDMPTIKKGLYLSEYFSDSSLVALIIVTCYYHKQCYEAFPKRIQELERRTQIYQQKAFHQQTSHRIYKKAMIVTAMGIFFFAVTTLIDFFYNLEKYSLFLRSSIVYILPNLTISLWFGQYWILLKFIVNRYEVLNSILDELSGPGIQKASSCSLLAEVMKGCGSPRRDTAAVLDDLKNIFAHLDTLVGEVNAVFGLTITANFLSSFLTLSVQTFILYKLPEDPEDCNWPNVLYALAWISLHSLRFIVILHINSSLLNVKSRTGIILNNFEAEKTKTEEAINRFLMQLVVRNSVQMACGIIELDMELIGGVISALSIYVIFLIQIDLGEVVLTAGPPSNSTLTNNQIKSQKTI